MISLSSKNLTEPALDFLALAFAELERKNFVLEKRWPIDHLCYRTSTEDNYLIIKRLFESFSKLLIESEVNGRLISTFKLEAPIVFREWEIGLIEVPAPKKGKLVTDGFAVKFHHMSLESVIEIERE